MAGVVAAWTRSAAADLPEHARAATPVNSWTAMIAGSAGCRGRTIPSGQDRVAGGGPVQLHGSDLAMTDF